MPVGQANLGRVLVDPRDPGRPPGECFCSDSVHLCCLSGLLIPPLVHCLLVSRHLHREGVLEAERARAEAGEDLCRSPWLEGMSGRGGVGVLEELRGWRKQRWQVA